MRKIYLSVFILFINIISLFAQANDSLIYKSKKLKFEEVNFISSYYRQEGNNSSVTGGIGTQKLSDYANIIDVKFSKYSKTFKKHTFGLELGVDHFTTASGDNVDPSTKSAASAKDTRIYPSFSWQMNNEQKQTTYGLGLSYSHEFDYRSYGGSFVFGKKVRKDKSGEVIFKIQGFVDQLKLAYPVELIPYNREVSTTTGASGDRRRNDDNTESGKTKKDADKEADAILNGFQLSTIQDSPVSNTIGSRSLDDDEDDGGDEDDDEDDDHGDEDDEDDGDEDEDDDYEDEDDNYDDTDQDNSFNNVTGRYPKKLRGTVGVSLTYNQIINKNIQLGFSLDATYQRGYLGLPFHRVYFEDKSVAVEKLPGDRFKLAASARGSFFIGDRLIIRPAYRFYYDTWKILANTVSIETPIKITPFISVVPFYRFYHQFGTDYFAPYAQHKLGETYYTSNYDLSKFHSHFVGAGFRFAPPNGVFKLKHFNMVEIRYGFYKKNLDFQAHIVTLQLKFK